MATTPKEPVLRARVDAQTKERFEALCAALGESASDRMRQLVEDYVRQHAGVFERVRVQIDRPAAYEHGAWRVTAALTNQAEAYWDSMPIGFSLPELEYRKILIPDLQYRTAVIGQKSGLAEIGGKFHEGLWHADIYTNGIAEDDNPTTIDAVKAALTEQITKALEVYHGKRK